VHGVKHLPLHPADHLAGVFLVPAPVEVLGDDPELHQEVAREIRGREVIERSNLQTIERSKFS
jgi:hypothetical protein